MKSTGEHTDPEELLVKYITGEANANEIAQVEAWIKASGENLRHYEHFKQIWEESLNLADEKAVDEDLAWARFKQRIDTKPAIETKPVIRHLWLKIAAAVVLTFGAMLVGKMLMRSGDDARYT